MPTIPASAPGLSTALSSIEARMLARVVPWGLRVPYDNDTILYPKALWLFITRKVDIEGGEHALVGQAGSLRRRTLAFAVPSYGLEP